MSGGDFLSREWAQDIMIYAAVSDGDGVIVCIYQ